MKHIATYVTHSLTQTPWWAHGLFSMAFYGALKASLILLPLFTGFSIPAIFKIIPPEIFLCYPLIPLIVSTWSIQKHRRILAGQDSISRLNNMDMPSFSEAVVTRLTQWGFTVVQTQSSPGPRQNSIKMIRNGEMHLVFIMREDLLRPRHIQEYTNILYTEGIHKGIVISTGLIPRKTEIYSGNMFLELIDGKTLLAFLDQSFQAMDDQDKGSANRIRSMINARYPVCPVCQSVMVVHLGRNNGRPGKTCWKCSRQPECQGSISFKLPPTQAGL